MINEIMKRLSELPNVTMDDGQEYIQLYDAMETVKRALEQEPCEDAISRQGDDRWLIHFGQNMAIPSAESKWILCSERLPEYTADYTVTVGINNGNRMYYAVRTALYQIRFNQWIVYESEKTLVGEVIAWQESPEPYKAERE